MYYSDITAYNLQNFVVISFYVAEQGDKALLSG